jgi:hypothetical protein
MEENQSHFVFMGKHGYELETWFINHYVSYCETHGIPINKQLFI